MTNTLIGKSMLQKEEQLMLQSANGQGRGLGKDPEYHFQHLLAMVPLTRPQHPADNKMSPKNRTHNKVKKVLLIFPNDLHKASATDLYIID